MLETVLLGKRDFLFFLLVYFFCFPGGSVVKNPLANVGDAGDVGLIPGLGRFPGGVYGNPQILAWKIPWTEEPGGLQSMGSQRVRYGLAIEQQCSLAGRESTCNAETLVQFLGREDLLEKG